MAFLEVSPMSLIKNFTAKEEDEILTAGMDAVFPKLKRVTELITYKKTEVSKDLEKAELAKHLEVKNLTQYGKKIKCATYAGSIVRNGIVTRRNEIAAVLEYGRYGRGEIPPQEPTHFIEGTLQSNKELIRAAMQNKIDEINERKD